MALKEMVEAILQRRQGWGSGQGKGSLPGQRGADASSSVQFSRSVMSDSLRPHELQNTRPPCPSPTPGVHPNLSILPCIVRILRQNIQKLVTELHLAVLRNKKGGDVGASMRNSTHGKGHEEGGSAYAKAGSSLRSPPGNSRASTPRTRVCLLSALCSHLHL